LSETIYEIYNLPLMEGRISRRAFVKNTAWGLGIGGGALVLSACSAQLQQASSMLDLVAGRTTPGINDTQILKPWSDKNASSPLSLALNSLILPVYREWTSITIADTRAGEILYELNPERYRKPASTRKVPISYAALDKAYRSNSDPDTIRIAATRHIEGTSAPEWVIEGEKYPLRDLVQKALIYSDNTAANSILTGYVGETEMVHQMTEWGIGASRVDHPFVNDVSEIDQARISQVTSRDMAQFMFMLSRRNQEHDPAAVDVLGLLGQTELLATPHDFPSQALYRAKPGMVDSVYNEIGLLQTRAKEYAIAIFCEQDGREIAPHVVNAVLQYQ
jgi:beta-lactamase class A